MKAITLIQPWATLVALGEKRIETRSWKTNFRGELAIHAGKRIDKGVFNQPFYNEVLKKYGITPDNIKTSAIIATCKIADVIKTESLRYRISEQELAFGNYEPNRFGWILEDLNQIEPIEDVKGMLGLWNYNVESEALHDRE